MAAAGPVLLSADGTSVFFQGTVYDKNPNQVAPKNFIDKVAIKTGEKERIYESENKGSSERVSTVIDADGKKFIVTRESPPEVPQNFLLDLSGRAPRAADEEHRRARGPDARAKIERFVVERPDGFKFRVKVTLPPDMDGRQQAAGALLVLPARVRDAGRVRPPGSHIQQERVHRLRHALDGVFRPPRLRRGRARHADRRPAGADEQQLRERSAQRPVGDNRRARSPRYRGPAAPGDRRPQLRRILDRERDGAHAVLQGGHRRRRRLQPHADSAGLPDRASRSVGGAERLPRPCRHSSMRTT